MILIDGRLLSNKPTGISRYTIELINSYNLRFGIDNVSVLLNTESNFGFNNEIVLTRFKPFNLFHFFLFPFFFDFKRFSLYHSAFYSSLAFRVKDVYTITTIHDLMFYKVKEFFSDNFIINYFSFIYYFIIVKLSLKNSNLCISVSVTTQIDTRNLFDIDSIVIPEGVNTSLSNSLFKRETLFQFPEKSFFLYVGNGRKHKNLKLLIEAFRLYKGNKKLIIVGNINAEFLNIPNIIQIDFIPDELLSLYYKNCAAFIFPSLYEGFGLPILEAISHSAVVFSSKNGSLSEFKFNSIHFFDPNEVLELLDLMNSSDAFKFVNSDMVLLNRYNWELNFKLFHDILNQKLALI